MKPRVFLSAALFTYAEREFNRHLAQALIEAGYEVILPQDFEIEEHEREIFDQCVAGIQKADLVLAVVDGAETDAGVGFELGLAWARGIPIVALRTDFRRRAETEHGGVNLMIQYGVSKLINSASDPFNSIIKVLERFRPQRPNSGREG